MSALLEVEDLNVSIITARGQLKAVRSVSLNLNKGETLCLVGESGCGKSMTALGIMDLLPSRAQHSATRLVLQGTDLMALTAKDMADIRGNQMAMIFQEPMTSLNPVYTIGNQLMEAMLRHLTDSKSKAHERAVFLLEKVGITSAPSRMRQYPYELSGGLRQRVMIAMALMCGPELIIADEPTTALDVTIQAQILYLLAELQREFHMAMILITHDLTAVSRMADRVAVMYAGQIVEIGTVQEILINPMHPYTQRLLFCIPRPGMTKPGEHLGTIPGTVPTLIGENTGCSFRNRCQYAQKTCASQNVQIYELQSDHAYRCILEPEICRSNAQQMLI